MIISTSGMFCDPLGVLAPVTIWFKVLFQKLCEKNIKVDLDQMLAGNIVGRIKDPSKGSPREPSSLHSDSQKLFYRYWWRCMWPHIFCGFCDASTSAFAAVVYLILETEMVPLLYRFIFVVVETRVALLQAQIIPRFELRYLHSSLSPLSHK